MRLLTLNVNSVQMFKIEITNMANSDKSKMRKSFNFQIVRRCDNDSTVRKRFLISRFRLIVVVPGTKEVDYVFNRYPISQKRNIVSRWNCSCWNWCWEWISTYLDTTNRLLIFILLFISRKRMAVPKWNW